MLVTWSWSRSCKGVSFVDLLPGVRVQGRRRGSGKPSMSAEFRHIFFNDAELLHIVSGYDRLPAGSVLDLKVAGEALPRVEGRVAPDRGGQPVAFVLEGEDLKSAVISYCIKDNIPLPQRGAKKRLQVFGDRLALIITINVTADRLSEL